MGSKEDIKVPVKKLSKEITKKYIHEITKEAIKRTVSQRVEIIKDKDILRLEKKLKKLTDNDKIDQFKGPGDDIINNISEEGLGDKEIIKKLNSEFGEKFDTRIPKLLAGKGLPWAVKIIIVIFIIYIGAVLIIPHPSPPPPPPPTPQPIISINPDPLVLDFEEIRNEQNGMQKKKPGPKTFSISNAGDGILTWSINSDQPWILLSPASGTNYGDVTVSINSDNLQNGKHSGTITIYSNGGTLTGSVSISIVTALG